MGKMERLGKFLFINSWNTEIKIGDKQQMNETRQIALQRIHSLFRLAKEKIREEPQLAQRYAEVARKIAMRAKLRLPKEYRRMICRHCKSFIYPGVNCRVRVQQKREPHMVITCLVCGKITRIPLKSMSPKKEKKTL
jgi:ribonuclease P protein subunit RPR2